MTILGNYTPYIIYDKFETNKDDTSSLTQNIDGEKELTLVTCNNTNGNRIIIKAKTK
ncbi:MAG: sortase [Oscillospiraceae bacterium]|nr:sortase [Oscillospiraceae bacterium]